MTIALLQYTIKYTCSLSSSSKWSLTNPIPVSKDVQPVEAPHEPELTKALVSMTLGTGARLKILKMTSPEDTSTEQVGIKPPLAEQQ